MDDSLAAIWDRVTVPDTVAPTIIKFETCVLHPYRDSVGVWTEGDGDTVLMNGTRVVSSSPNITLAQAQALLARDMATYGPAIAHAIPVPLTLGWVTALYSLVHNEGTGVLDKSLIPRMLVAGRPDLAADQLPAWVVAGGKVALGLQRRRWAERLITIGTPLLQAYTTAWGMNAAQLAPAYHQSFIDAYAFVHSPSKPPAPPLPAGLVTTPATEIVPEPVAA